MLMQKYKKLFLITLLFIPLLASCGNKDILGTTYTFKYATIKLPDGSIIDGEVKFTNGKGEYLTHLSNVILYNK